MPWYWHGHLADGDTERNGGPVSGSLTDADQGFGVVELFLVAVVFLVGFFEMVGTSTPADGACLDFTVVVSQVDHPR